MSKRKAPVDEEADFDDDDYRRMNDKNSQFPKKSNDNFCMKNCKRCFKRFYPKKPIAAKTEVGGKLRFFYKAAVVLHILFFIFCLAIVGYRSMTFNLILAAMSYSCFLTLSNSSSCMYFLFLCFDIGYAVFKGIW